MRRLSHSFDFISNLTHFDLKGVKKLPLMFSPLFIGYVVYIMLYTAITLKILLFGKNNLKKEKSPSAKGQRAGNGLAPPIGQLQNF